MSMSPSLSDLESEGTLSQWESQLTLGLRPRGPPDLTPWRTSPLQGGQRLGQLGDGPLGVLVDLGAACPALDDRHVPALHEEGLAVEHAVGTRQVGHQWRDVRRIPL